MTARLVTVLELFGGLFLVVGLVVPVVASFLVVQILAKIAMKSSIMKAGFQAAGGKPGYEIDFTYLLLSLAILLLGAGAYSLDAVAGLL